MTVGLLDVNMLIALAWPSHVHHQAAHAWFGKHSTEGWATCPVTQCGFVRISSNPAIIREAVTPRQAMDHLGQIIQQKGHVFWPDDIGLLDALMPTQLLVGHRQVTDAYLLGLALRRKGRLVTLDAGLAALLPARSPQREALCLVPTAT